MQKVNVIRITASTRELFRIMNFVEIPEEAQFVAFFETGEAQFMTELDGTLGFPRLYTVAAYKDLEVKF